MTTKPAKRPYTATALPTDLYDRIKSFIESDPRHHYVSVLEFIKDSVRRRFDELDVQRRAGDVGQRLDDLRPDADRAASKLRAAAPNAKPRFCHKCGEPLPAGAVFCPACGTRSG